MSYNKELRALFASNYSLSFPVKYDGFGLVDPTTNQPLDDQLYSEGPWLEVYSNGGPTIYGTIGTIGTRQANVPFTYVITIHLPVTNHESVTTYNRDDADAIIAHLDGFMLTDGFVVSANEMIYSSQVQPKQTFPARPSPDDNFMTVTVEYLYTYNYYPNML